MSSKPLTTLLAISLLLPGPASAGGGGGSAMMPTDPVGTAPRTVASLGRGAGSQELFAIPLPDAAHTTGGDIRVETASSLGIYSLDVRGTLAPIVVRTSLSPNSDASAEFRVTLGGFSGSAGVSGPPPVTPETPPPAPGADGAVPPTAPGFTPFDRFGFQIAPVGITFRSGRAALVIGVSPIEMSSSEAADIPGSMRMGSSARADATAGEGPVTGRIRGSVRIDLVRPSGSCPPQGCAPELETATLSGEASISVRVTPDASLDLGVTLSRSLLLDPGLGTDAFGARLSADIDLHEGELLYLSADASTTRMDPGLTAGPGPSTPPVSVFITAGAAF